MKAMKKFCVTFLSCALLFGLCACTPEAPDSTVEGGPTFSPDSCPHMTVTDAAVAPTCTEEGKTAGRRCIGCGTVFEAQQTIPPLGHSFEEGVCTRCGAEEHQH